MDDALEGRSTPCLTDEELMAFAVGRLDESRRAEAHAHLDECPVCPRLLVEAVRSLATAPTLPALDWDGSAWNTTFHTGSIVDGRYQIVRFIARGGMGEVYEAFDSELQERVALKTVTSTAGDDPTAVRRLKGEVQLARRVSHPNVCRIYDFGTHVMADTGAPISFLTMEFVDGETLGARLRAGGALPIAEARRLGRQLLLGLSAAHDAGVLHRDFKSDNVMLKEGNGQTHPLISDFGLARAFDGELRRAGSVSNAGLVGTISYLAPEQLQGKPHTIPSDIYSLGMVWFEMLTGELPFDESPNAAVAALERMQKQAPLASSRNPSVPRDLDAVVAGCLRRLPKQRFKSTAEVLSALDELERSSRPFRSRRKMWLIPAAAGLLALVGLGASSQQSPASAELPGAAQGGSPGVSGRLDAEAGVSGTATAVGGALFGSGEAPPPEPTPKQTPKRRSKPASPKPRPSSSGKWEDPFGKAEARGDQ